jgi:hypothetical protein
MMKCEMLLLEFGNYLGQTRIFKDIDSFEYTKSNS